MCARPPQAGRSAVRAARGRMCAGAAVRLGLGAAVSDLRGRSWGCLAQSPCICVAVLCVRDVSRAHTPWNDGVSARLRALCRCAAPVGGV